MGMGVKTVALSLLAAALAPCTAARGASVTWNLAAPLPHPVSPGLFSFTADFHAPESSCHGSGPKQCWRNASILNADLNQPRLRAAAKLMRGAFWRIGGSPADQTIYEFGGTACPRSCAPLVTAVRPPSPPHATSPPACPAAGC